MLCLSLGETWFFVLPGRSLEKEQQQQQQQQHQSRQAPFNNGKMSYTKSTEAHQQNGVESISSSAARNNNILVVERTNGLHVRDGGDGLFAALYPNLPEEDGLNASRNERLANGYRSITLTYGEVSASGVSSIVS